MSEPQEQIEAIIKAGATVGVTLADGQRLRDWPAMYAEYTEAGYFQFWWAGFDEHLHIQKVASWTVEDGLHLHCENGDDITLGYAWAPQDRKLLSNFWAAPGRENIPYPVTGAHYAEV